MLDGVRYLVVWNPVILMGMHFCLHFFGIDRFAEARHKGDKEALMIMSQHHGGLHAHNATFGHNASSINGTQMLW